MVDEVHVVCQVLRLSRELTAGTEQVSTEEDEETDDDSNDDEASESGELAVLDEHDSENSHSDNEDRANPVIDEALCQAAETC